MNQIKSILHSLKRIYLGVMILCTSVAGVMAQEAPANIRLKEATLMYEMRATPSPINKAVVADRAISFQWPLHGGAQVLESGLDGSQAAPKKKVDKSKLRYKLRYSQDPMFKKKHSNGRNPLAVLQPGERLDTRCMALAIWLRNQRKGGMEQHTAIHRKGKPGQVLSTLVERSIGKATRFSSPCVAG